MIVADIITFIKNRLRKRVLSHQFFLVLTILKTCGSFKNDQFLVKKKKKVKSLHKYRPVSNGATFSAKFVLDAKVKVGASGSIIKFRSLSQLTCSKYEFEE